MTSSGAEFRQTRVGVLGFLASAEEQHNFAHHTCYEDYATEFLLWWLDDFHPTSLLFRAAFTEPEIELLKLFSSEIDVLDGALGIVPRSITQLHGDLTWLKVMAAARTALEALNVGTT